MFGFNSAKYDLNLIKSYLLPILVNERDIEPTVINKANQFISFKFGDIQPLDTMNFLGGATSLDSFLKANKTSETKGFFPLRKVWSPWQNAEYITYPIWRLLFAFYSKLHFITLWKPSTRVMLIYWKVDWPQNRLSSIYNYQSHPLLGLRNINTCNKYGSRNKWARSETFCGGIRIKMLYHL